MIILKQIILIVTIWLAPDFVYNFNGERQLVVDDKQKVCKILVLDEHYKMQPNWRYVEGEIENDNYEEVCGKIGYKLDAYFFKGEFVGNFWSRVIFTYLILIVFYSFFIYNLFNLYKSEKLKPNWLIWYVLVFGTFFLFFVLNRVLFKVIF